MVTGTTDSTLDTNIQTLNQLLNKLDEMRSANVPPAERLQFIQDNTLANIVEPEPGDVPWENAFLHGGLPFQNRLKQMEEVRKDWKCLNDSWRNGPFSGDWKDAGLRLLEHLDNVLQDAEREERSREVSDLMSLWDSAPDITEAFDDCVLTAWGANEPYRNIRNRISKKEQKQTELVEQLRAVVASARVEAHLEEAPRTDDTSTEAAPTEPVELEEETPGIKEAAPTPAPDLVRAVPVVPANQEVRDLYGRETEDDQVVVGKVSDRLLPEMAKKVEEEKAQDQAPADVPPLDEYMPLYAKTWTEALKEVTLEPWFYTGSGPAHKVGMGAVGASMVWRWGPNEESRKIGEVRWSARLDVAPDEDGYSVFMLINSPSSKNQWHKTHVSAADFEKLHRDPKPFIEKVLGS